MKVALLFICTGSQYWPFAKEVIEGAKKYFLTNHKVDYFLWSDMPDGMNYGVKVFETEATEWPYPTLMRYHLFLQQEETLKNYDYIFYCDVDMRFVGEVGDEILGDLTMAQHPMYALRREYVPPWEPNPASAAYIPRLGRIITYVDGRRIFEPLYAAGGFQGGKSENYLKAMKVMKRMIDRDLTMNYIPIWNDESIWNRYLYDCPPTIVLSPSYVYPDSLINEYYNKIWGRTYEPKIITLTKKFTTSKEAGEILQRRLTEM